MRKPSPGCLQEPPLVGMLAESTPLTQPAAVTSSQPVPLWSTLCIASAGLTLSPGLPFSVTPYQPGLLGTACRHRGLVPRPPAPCCPPPSLLGLSPSFTKRNSCFSVTSLRKSYMDSWPLFICQGGTKCLFWVALVNLPQLLLCVPLWDYDCFPTRP